MVPVELTARAWPAGELWAGHSRTRAAFTVAVSRSGETTETVEAVQSLSGPVVAVTCDGASPLAESADVVVAVEAAQERSVVQTSAFTSMIISFLAAAGVNIGEAPKPEDWSQFRDGIALKVQDVARERIPRAVYVLGSGSRLPLAHEIALKITEMALIPGAAYSFMEFRHGPMSMAASGVTVIGLLDQDAMGEADVLDTARQLGASVVGFGDDFESSPQSGPFRDMHLVVAGQELALHLALVQDLDPDRPRNLTAVVNLENRPVRRKAG